MVHAANEAPKLRRQLAAFLLCQKFAYLVSPAVRFDDESAAMEGRFRVADFNPCPVAREHDAARISARIFDDDFRLRDVDALALEASLHIRAQRPAEKEHFGTRE